MQFMISGFFLTYSDKISFSFLRFDGGKLIFELAGLPEKSDVAPSSAGSSGCRRLPADQGTCHFYLIILSDFIYDIAGSRCIMDKILDIFPSPK